MKKITLLTTIIFTAVQAMAQVSQPFNDAQISANSVVYSLPKTTIKIRLEVEKEIFTAGPYAAYAQKYLSIDANAQNTETFTIRKIEMMPFQEADANALYTINFGKLKNARATFLAISQEGLILSENYKDDNGVNSRFAITQNQRKAFLNNEKANSVERAIYVNNAKNNKEKNSKAGKNIEAKAAETAELITNLRDKRIDIVSGESDFTGEGVKAALDEINRIEAENIVLFTGTSEKSTQIYYFDVIPNAAQSSQSYIAFRFSEKQGPTAITNVGGRPIMLNIETEKSDYSDAQNDENAKKQKTELIHYRVPKTTKVTLMDGTDILLQDRFPIYQFGNIITIPAELKIK